MPYKDVNKARAAKREWARKNRAKLRAVSSTSATLPPGAKPLEFEGDAAERIRRWSLAALRVPPGHPNAGEPMVLPDFGVRFIRDALAHRESLLCMARKNAKSAIIAVLLLAHLVGPLRRPGWRAGVASVNKEKAGELKSQMEAIALASGIILGTPDDRLRFLRSPTPGRVVSRDTGGSVDILSADKSSGHASGFDLAIIDELGLLAERDRPLVNGLRSSTSAKDGRFLSLSIRGDSPFTQEMIDRHQAGPVPGLAVHLYAAEEHCELDDREAWQAANPGLGTIKSLAYMEDEAARVLAVTPDQSAFRAFDLNQRLAPGRQMICSVAEWSRCVVDALPAPDGPVVIGFDLGGSSSMTAGCLWWLQTGRVEVYGAFPGEPDLAARGRADGVGSRYLEMQADGELVTYPGLVTPVSEFLQFLHYKAGRSPVLAAGADRYRKDEGRQALRDAGASWPIVWRGQGASPTADGSADIRAFQRAVLSRAFSMRRSQLMESAIAESAIVPDKLGNPGLYKARARGRIDVLSAAVIAAGLAERAMRYEAPRVAVV